MATGISPPSVSGGAPGIWRTVDFVYGAGGSPVAAMVYTADTATVPGFDTYGRLMVCQYDSANPPNALTPQTLVDEQVLGSSLGRRASGVLDLFYITSSTLYHSTSHDNGATWSAGAAQTVSGVTWFGQETGPGLDTLNLPMPLRHVELPGGLYLVFCYMYTTDVGCHAFVGSLQDDGTINWTAPTVLLLAFPAPDSPEVLADGSVMMWSYRGYKVTQVDSVGNLTLTDVGYSGSGYTSFGGACAVDPRRSYAQFMEMYYDPAGPINQWTPGAYLRDPADGLTWDGKSSSVPFDGYVFRDGGGTDYFGYGADLKINAAGVWEFLYPDATNTLVFVRCRNQQPGTYHWVLAHGLPDDAVWGTWA
jgi:hypothetical protein